MKTNDVILQTGSKVLFFIILLFAVYIFFAGHNSPGGGFVGGLLTTGAFVLLLLAYDLKTVKQLLPFNFMIVVAIGLLLSLGMAAGSLVVNVRFLTHAFGGFSLPLFGESALHTATSFDAGGSLVVFGAV